MLAVTPFNVHGCAACSFNILFAPTPPSHSCSKNNACVYMACQKVCERRSERCKHTKNEMARPGPCREQCRGRGGGGAAEGGGPGARRCVGGDNGAAEGAQCRRAGHAVHEMGDGVMWMMGTMGDDQGTQRGGPAASQTGQVQGTVRVWSAGWCGEW